MPLVAYLVKIQDADLPLEEQVALAARLQCAAVIALPQRILAGQVIVQPKTNDRSG